MKQLIIINNKDTIEECQELEIIHHSTIAIIDRPKFSNGRALLQALQHGAGQVIVHFPLNYYHNSNRIEDSIKFMAENDAMIISPEFKHTLVDGKIVSKGNSPNIIAELAIYSSPAYTDDYEIDYGAWWQYPLLANEHGIDIIGVEECWSVEFPSEEPPENYFPIFNNE
jgi:hypothetical protein